MSWNHCPKLYMVSPFLASLKSLISSHPPPMAPRPDLPLKGICVWKAKHSSTGSSSTFMDSQPTKPENESKNLDIVGPGRSFRNFKFNTALILQAMETAFLLEGPATFLWISSNKPAYEITFGTKRSGFAGSVSRPATSDADDDEFREGVRARLNARR
ncbi:hypothetical protein S245_040674, partial [Arachis hypogaea]